MQNVTVNPLHTTETKAHLYQSYVKEILQYLTVSILQSLRTLTESSDETSSNILTRRPSQYRGNPHSTTQTYLQLSHVRTG